MGQAMYAANPEAGAGGPGATGGGDAPSADEDVVDAEIVDEPESTEGGGSAA
jgi:molecular chaperone DnaK